MWFMTFNAAVFRYYEIIFKVKLQMKIIIQFCYDSDDK